MAELAINRVNDYITSVIEDPTLSNNRIFVNGQSYNSTTLSPNWMETWHMNISDKWASPGWQEVGGTAGFNGLGSKDWAPMSLEKGTIQCWGNAESQAYNNLVMDTYNRSMDFANYPVRRAWKTYQGNNLFAHQSYHYTTSVFDTMNEQLTFTRSDCAAYNSTYYSIANATTIATGMAQFCYEDVANNRMFGICKVTPGFDVLNAFNLYDTIAPTMINNTIINTTTNGGSLLFMGTDAAGWTWWLQNYDSTTALANQYVISKVNPIGAAVTTVINQSTRGLLEVARNSRPSNIKRTSDTRRVFYSSHFDNIDQLAPIRYVWDTVGSTIITTNCTMLYPNADYYNTHATKFSSTGGVPSSGLLVGNNWIIEGHQFSSSGTDYITYFVMDLSATYASGPTRWSTPAKRTALTYVVGAANNATLLNCNITGTNLTFTSSDNSLMPGMILSGSGVSAGTKLLTESLNNITSFVITGVAGQFTCTSTTLYTNQPVKILGTLGGTGSIGGYTSGMTYYIQSGATGTSFTLLNTPSGTAVATTTGTPTGLNINAISWLLDTSSTVTGSISLTATPTVATLTNAAISGITLTFASSSGSTIVPGMIITGTGVKADTYITSGSSLTWTINQTQTVSSTTMRAMQGAATFTGAIANGTAATLTTASVTGDKLTFASSTGATVVPGMVLSGGTILAGTYIVSGSGLSWIVSPAQMTAAVVPTTATPTVLTASSVIGTLAIGTIINGGTATINTVITGLGTGTGGAGTYYVSPSQNVSSVAMTGLFYPDDRLRYHSKMVYTAITDLPRNMLPINTAGTQIAVPNNAGALTFYNWSDTLGWTSTGIYPVEFRQIGLDQNNRLWGTSKEKGYNTIHLITPTMPITVTAVMASSSYTYAGTNISTTASVNAYSSTGARLASSVTLTIDGSSMIFTSTGTKTVTITTSASVDTTVNITITSGGISNIVANVSV